MPDASERKGSISSERPEGEKTWQWCAERRGARVGSTRWRWASASVKRVRFVEEGGGRMPAVVEGDVSVEVEVEAAGRTREPPGVERGAFVPWGSAGRGVAEGIASSMSPVE